MFEFAVSVNELKYRQSLSLVEKESFTADVISQWHEYWGGQVHVSFSGGKDSAVLLEQVRRLFPEVPAVFIDTGLEYPEIRSFVKTIDNVVWLKPKKRFPIVLTEYGYPIVSKKVSRFIKDLQNKSNKNEKTCKLRLTGYNQYEQYCSSQKLSAKWRYLINAPFKISDDCCRIMKKDPAHIYVRETNTFPMLGIMASNSSARERQYRRYGCNAYSVKYPVSNPLSIWNDSNIWEYIRKYSVPYSKIYDMGYHNTGCMFCMFGVHMERGENRFQKMARTHPKHYKYCIEKLGLGEVLAYVGVDYKPIKGLIDHNVLENRIQIE